MSVETTLLQFGVPARYARLATGMIGHGTEGAAYELEGGTRVLKVNVKSKGQAITHIARRVKGRAWAAPIYACGLLHPPGLSPRGFWYTAPKMYPLSAREQRVLDAIGFSLIANAKGYLAKPLLEAKWRQALSLLPPALQNTLRKARAAGYHDLHGRNVMKTAGGVYKVIDVESLRPLPRRA